MTDKAPVLLAVLIETGLRRWFVAGVTLDGRPVPLLRSATGNLDPYRGAAPDVQLDFLRHRLSGVLQRGCDRLWGRRMKPCQIVFLADDDFEPAHPELTQAVADHFVLWMSQPPVAFLTSENGFPRHQGAELRLRAGSLADAHRQALVAALPPLVAALDQSDPWEMVPTKPTS